ncbi:hypothetical protein [Methanocella sp. MCL-LM]|uniref:hypothetical protein n=1 Tax=Methanocella sp. MCL-LM TaxID=3412035 RepID=UPI003C75183A
MIARSWVLLIMLVLIAGMLAVSGCTSDSDTLPQDKYVAVEEHLRVSSKLIDGTYPFPPHVTMPVIYSYDGIIDPAFASRDYGYYPEINDSFKVLYGTTIEEDLTYWNTWVGLRIKGLYHFPYTGESGFTLQKVDSDGTIYGSYNNTSIVLKTGDMWESPIYSETRTDSGMAFGDTPYQYTAIYNTTWTIINRGVHDKANLTRYHNNLSDTGYYMVYR